MRKDRTSLTAIGIAVARAVESEKPADVRICYDPYARRFISPWLYRLLAFFIASGYAERRGPGVMGFLAARERYIDDVLQKALDDGLEQLVILGAGYDSRAYRFEALAGRVKGFEVDHPATQRDKLDKLRAVFGKIPDHVAYVPVDFNTQTLEQRLPASGYDPGLKTLFIWQGVTMYLSAEAVDATLAFVIHHSRQGSSIVFDYIHRAALDGVDKPAEVSGMRRYRFMTGEGLTFGIAAGSAEAFLKARGFSQVCEIDSDGLRRAYFSGKNERRSVALGYGIAVAVV